MTGSDSDGLTPGMCGPGIPPIAARTSGLQIMCGAPLEFPSHQSARSPCEPDRLGFEFVGKLTSRGPGMMTSNFMILPPMEVSMKSGEGQTLYSYKRRRPHST